MRTGLAGPLEAMHPVRSSLHPAPPYCPHLKASREVLRGVKIIRRKKSELDLKKTKKKGKVIYDFAKVAGKGCPSGDSAFRSRKGFKSPKRPIYFPFQAKQHECYPNLLEMSKFLPFPCPQASTRRRVFSLCVWCPEVGSPAGEFPGLGQRSQASGLAQGTKKKPTFVL